MSVPPASRPLAVRKLVPGVQTLAARPIPHLIPEIQLPLHAPYLLYSLFTILSTVLVDKTHAISMLRGTSRVCATFLGRFVGTREAPPAHACSGGHRTYF